MTRAKKQVVKKEDQLPSYMNPESSRGSENVDSNDVQIPRISVVQALSPQVDKDDPAYIKEAQVGDILNVLTGELYPDGLEFVPVFFEKDHLVWKTRKAGGGLVARCENEVEAAKLADTDANYEYVMSPNHICILLGPDREPLNEVAIPMAVSKHKVSRRFNSLIRLNGGDRFSRIYKLTSVSDENSAGEKYKNLHVENIEGWAPEAVYLAAEALYDQIQDGTKKYTTDYSDVKTDPGDGEPPSDDEEGY